RNQVTDVRAAARGIAGGSTRGNFAPAAGHSGAPKKAVRNLPPVSGLVAGVVARRVHVAGAARCNRAGPVDVAWSGTVFADAFGSRRQAFSHLQDPDDVSRLRAR